MARQVEALCRRLVRFPDPSCMGGAKKGEGRKGLVNNWTPTWTQAAFLQSVLMRENANVK